MRVSVPAVLCASALLGGCTVGSNYGGPPTTVPVAKQFVRAGGSVAPDQPQLARWWNAFNDPLLDRVMDKALAANPDLQAASARLQQARAGLRLERANQAPSASATALYAHARIPGLDLGSSDSNKSSGDSSSGSSQNGSGGVSDLNLYNLGFDASWEIDLFGGKRRSVEAARADLGAAEANLADAHVSLTAEVAQAYVNLRDRQQRIELNRRIVALQRQMLELTRQRFDRGTASRLDVVRLQTELENSRAEIVPLEAERASFLDELATLAGEAPGALDAFLGTAGRVPLPPVQVAVGDPAALLARRPDIRAAERRFAAANARVGVAEAARFPQLKLMGIIGLGGTGPSDLVDPGSLTMLAAPQLSWSFLDFGRNRARVVQAQAKADEAAALYRGAVLTALRDAEGALARFGSRRGAVATFARAEASADEAARLTAQRYQAGTTTMIDLLDVQRRQIAAQQNFVLAEAELTGDFIALHKALGLGWSKP